MYLVVAVTAAVGIAGRNLIGADQRGEIIFGHSASNLHLPVLALLFALFFSSVGSGLASLLTPDNGDAAAILFKRELYLLLVLMSGFLALAAYLCLPVEFFLEEMPGQLKAPYLAYLVLLIALVVMFGVMLGAELQANHPRFLQSLVSQSRWGASANLVEGLSFGYLGSAVPIVVWAGVGYLAYFWLGSLGAALSAVGVALLIPNYLAINTYFALVDNASFCVFVGQLPGDSITTLMGLAENRKVYGAQVHMHFTSLAVLCNYALALDFVADYELVRLPLNNPSIVAGLFLGAMLIYAFGAMTLLAIQNVAPVLCLDP